MLCLEGTLAAFQQQFQALVGSTIPFLGGGSPLTTAQAEGIVAAEFVASTLGAQAANLGLTPSDVAIFQQQQAAALNRTTKSGDHADATVTAHALVPVTVGDPGLGRFSKYSQGCHQRPEHGDGSGCQACRSDGGE